MGLETEARPVVRFPLAQADIGIAQTVCTMQQLIDSGSVDPEVRCAAIEIVRGAGISSRDDLGEASALFDWIRQNFRFTKDPVGKETIGTAPYLLHIRAGDCDDYVVALGALLKSLGHPVRIVTIAADPLEPARMSHVFLETLVKGRWLGLDPTQANVPVGWEPPQYYRRRNWGSMISGMASLGYVPEGFFSQGPHHIQPIGPERAHLPKPQVRASGPPVNPLYPPTGFQSWNQYQYWLRRHPRQGMRGLGQDTSGGGSPLSLPFPPDTSSWPVTVSQTPMGGSWEQTLQNVVTDFAQAGASRLAHGTVPVVSIPYLPGGTASLLTGASLGIGAGSVLLLVGVGIFLLFAMRR